MGEGIMRQRLEQNGLGHVHASSMGIHALEGRSATDLAVEICRENSIDISSHRSRPLIPEELKKSHFIFTMEPVQVDYLDLFFPQVSDRIFMLGSWPARKSKKATIDDPVGRPAKIYRKTFETISDRIDSLLPEIVQRFHRGFESGQ